MHRSKVDLAKYEVDLAEPLNKGLGPLGTVWTHSGLARPTLRRGGKDRRHQLNHPVTILQKTGSIGVWSLDEEQNLYAFGNISNQEILVSMAKATSATPS